MKHHHLGILLVIVAACGGHHGGGDGDGGVDANGGVVDGVPAPDALTCTGGTLCGEPASCCAAGNECVDDLCLPACDSGVRCGADLLTCCDAGDVCLGGACLVPGAACGDSYDCQPGEFCEPTLGQCLPQPDPLTCEYAPSFGTLTTTVEWSYTTDQIISIPVVANLDGVGAPEVVVNLTQMDGAGFPGGRIMILDGATGGTVLAPLAHNPPTSYGSHGRSTIAIGDVSGDGLPDIIYAARAAPTYSLIVAIDRTGALLWTSHLPNGNPYSFLVENAAITLANFDGDAQAEIVIGASLLDHDGTVLWNNGAASAGPTYGSNNGYQGGISAVADLDGDDKPEIVSGKNAWKVAWTAGPPATAAVTAYWTYAGDDGYPAVADLDQNGTPEVVLVANNKVITLNGQTGALITSIAIPGGATSNRGGPPTIADFDADGRPEIAVAGGYSYSVYDLNRPGEDIVQPPGTLTTPAAGAIYVRWTQATHDLSSNASGSSVFDFQGDGAAEVIYADECHMRVYTGTDGSVQLDVLNTTGTIHEYPLVVDVDGDGNSEILIVANDSNAAGDCPGQVANRGLYVYGDLNDEWVPTRKVWTQHAYHVTNATSAGNVPMVEDDNWEQPGLDNYRQNVQGDGVFNAPDLGVSLAAGLDACVDGQLVLRARVTNLGALGVPMGVEVSFYRGTDATGTLLGTGTTTTPLLPGQSTTVKLTIPAPGSDTDYFAQVDTATGTGIVVECDESNNGDGLTEAGCLIVR